MDDPPKFYRCEHCGRGFRSPESIRQHQAAVHIPGRENTPHFKSMRSKDRPRQRGPVPCRVCDMTFCDELAAALHRRAKHGEAQ